MNKLNDAELSEILKISGKVTAFNHIVNSYKEILYWHIRKILIDHEDSDDVLQNTFVKVWKGIDNFRWESKFFTWIYRIATNEAINFLNSKKRNNNISIDGINSKLISTLESDVYFDGDEQQKKLQKAILQLPDKQRIVFNMKYFDDLKYSQISEILETSEGALKASYHHAVKKIEDYLSSN